MSIHIRNNFYLIFIAGYRPMISKKTSERCSANRWGFVSGARLKGGCELEYARWHKKIGFK